MVMNLPMPYWPGIVLAMLTLPAVMLLSERLFWIAIGAAFGWHLAYSWLVAGQLVRAWRLHRGRFP